MQCDYDLVYNWHKLLIAAIDECDTSPCQNGGTCNDQIGAFECDCAPGYTDTVCSTGELSQYLKMPLWFDNGYNQGQ